MSEEEISDNTGLPKIRSLIELAETQNRDPIFLNINPGSEIPLNGHITFNDLIVYEENLLQTKSSREAFVAMLASLAIDENISPEEISISPDEELVRVGELYLERDKSLKELYKKTNFELSFFDRFEYANELQRKNFSLGIKGIKGIKNLSNDLQSLSKGIKLPLANAFANIQQIQDKLKFPDIKKEIVVHKTALDSLNELHKNDTEIYEMKMPELPSSPGYHTNELLVVLLREQRENHDKNRDIQESLTRIMDNMLKAQLEIGKESKKSTKIIITLTIIGIIAGLYGDKIKNILSNFIAWVFVAYLRFFS